MPPPSMLPQLGGVVVGVTAAARPPNVFSYSLLSIGLGSCPFSSGSSTRSRCSRRFSSNAEQSTRSRRWWSDEAQFDEDDDEFEEDEEGSSFGGSASWGQAFDEPWFTKASRAYGYVLPVILVSMLAATGPQAFLMAMAIPLAQSAVSFAIRAVSNTSFWGRRNQEYDGDYYSDYRSSGWEEPEQEEYSNTFSSSTKYKDSSSSQQRQQQPWAKDGKTEDSEPTADSDNTDSASSSSSSNTGKSGSSAGFGGWDELDAGDDQYRNSSSSSSRRSAGASSVADTASAATGGSGGAARSVRRRRPQPERRRPRSRAAAAARYRQSPLFMRLLVALFPFLGSWFRIML